VRILLVQRFDIQNVSCARRVTAFARQLDSRGHGVALVNFPHPERRESIPQLDVALPESVELIELNRRGVSLFTNIRRLSARAREFDLIHLWKSYPDAALPALHAARRNDLPIHYDWDDWETEITRELTGSGLAARLVGTLEERVPRMATTVSTASTELRRRALALGVPDDRIWDAPVGVDLDAFQAGDTGTRNQLGEKLWPGEEETDTPVLIYVGQLEVATFAETALEAVAKIRRPVRLLVVGGGSRLKALRQKAWSMGINHRVTFTDYVPAGEVPKYLSLARVALAPFDDTMVTRCKSPLKVMEYMAAGLPVVGSAVGDVPDLLENCGVTVPPGDAAAMAEAAAGLLENDNERIEMGRKARKKAEESFSWSRITDSLIAAYDTALS
jgi:glycosyltransferase involved in cell wall biosynthesis